VTRVEHLYTANTLVVAHKLDAIVWGLFFIWIGVALMAGIGWGLGLLGAGVITLFWQVTRTYFGLAVEPFWAVVALFFVLWGVWELLGLEFSLVPIMLIVASMVLLFSALRRPSP